MEQRRHRRLPASIRIFARDGGSGFPEPVKDISLGGVHVLTTAPLSVGAESTFALHLPHHDAPLELKGRVVWTNGEAMGVAFDRTEPRLTDFVDRLERDSARL
ncbi:MAG: PilZ domain-containing protein [Archangiaceae bacterium]|nr:PilZ domain-containing protein [Archangiaceae bacterium]